MPLALGFPKHKAAKCCNCFLFLPPPRLVLYLGVEVFFLIYSVLLSTTPILTVHGLMKLLGTSSKNRFGVLFSLLKIFTTRKDKSHNRLEMPRSGPREIWKDRNLGYRPYSQNRRREVSVE